MRYSATYEDPQLEAIRGPGLLNYHPAMLGVVRIEVEKVAGVWLAEVYFYSLWHQYRKPAQAHSLPKEQSSYAYGETLKAALDMLIEDALMDGRFDKSLGFEPLGTAPSGRMVKRWMIRTLLRRML
jgi:hypothetical protein